MPYIAIAKARGFMAFFDNVHKVEMKGEMIMVFNDLLLLIDELDNDQLNTLRNRIDQRQQNVGFQMGDLLEIIDDFRQDLSQSDLDEMFEMMNQE